MGIGLLSSTQLNEHVRTQVLTPQCPHLFNTTTYEIQFQNCALYNKWTKKEQLVYLRSSLEKDAGQVSIGLLVPCSLSAHRHQLSAAPTMQRSQDYDGPY